MKINNLPLVIDLDGTLINTDLLFESFFRLIKNNPLYAFKSFMWAIQGKSVLKSKIAERVEIDVSSLPYNTELLNYLISQKGKRKLILASASNIKFVSKVAKHIGIFDHYLASDNNLNLSGDSKAKKIKEFLGNNDYVYAGNSSDDFPIWDKCKKAITVNLPHHLSKKLLRKSIHIDLKFNVKNSTIISWIKCLRIHQWVKNLLIFVPLILSQQYLIPSQVLESLLAFFVFGLCASSVYLLNDLLDIQDDRLHPTKRNRPIPSGKVSLAASFFLIPTLLIISLYIAATLLPLEFNIILLFYYFLTLIYSFKLKRVILLDVQILSSLYTLRLLAGTAAINEVYSFWLTTFSIFIFLSLALVKRYSELANAELHKMEVSGRGYKIKDKNLLLSLGTSSGYVSLLVLALFINSNQIFERYSSPYILWLIIPILLYWISRVWIISSRGEMHDDPVVFAIKDKVSLFLFTLLFITLMGAILI